MGNTGLGTEVGPKPRSAVLALPQKPQDTLSSLTNKATSPLTFLHTSSPLSPAAFLPILRPSPGRNSTMGQPGKSEPVQET